MKPSLTDPQFHKYYDKWRFRLRRKKWIKLKWQLIEEGTSLADFVRSQWTKEHTKETTTITEAKLWELTQHQDPSIKLFAQDLLMDDGKLPNPHIKPKKQTPQW